MEFMGGTMSYRSGYRSASLLCLLFVVACGALFAEHTPHSYLKVPLSFEPNQGQADARFDFVSRGGGYTLLLNPTEARLKLREAHLQMTLAGGNAGAEGQGADLLIGTSNYLLGDDPAAWHRNIPNYGRVEYRGVYPGIDLIYYGNQRRIEYDFVVAPGADPKAIRLNFEGASDMKVDRDGNLIVDIAGGSVSFESPVVYQEVGGTRKQIKGKYVVKDSREVRFQIGSYDKSRTLVIDPILTFSTYFGGFAGDDLGYGVATDNLGNGYMVGLASSMDFPTRSAVQPAFNGDSDAFVAKFSPAGGLIYSTYLGGAGFDQAIAVVADAGGNAYVTGLTSSTNFPSVKPYQAANAGGDSDVFVTKLNPAGTAILYSTYLGGSRIDRGYAIALDSVDNSVYLTGVTDSTNFPLANAIQNTSAGAAEAFASKLSFTDPILRLTYSTYLGGSSDDQGNGIKVDAIGNAYIAGTTASMDFPSVAAKPLPLYNHSGDSDAFVTKLNASGNVILYWTFLGGSFFDQGNGIAVDGAFNAHVVGRTNSIDFPSTALAVQPAHGGSADAFVTKMDPTGMATVYSTFVGGSGFDQGLGIGLDGTGNAYITGSTTSANFPVFDALQPVNKTFGEAFVTAVNNIGTRFVYSTYLGGDGGDIGTSIAVHTPPPPGSPQAFVSGYTDSMNFPVVSAFQSTKGPGFKAFLTNISTAAPAPAITSLTFNPNPVTGGSSSTGTVTLATPAPQGGATITLSSSNPAVVTVPASFVIPAGSLTGTFTANTVAVTSPADVTVRATSGASFDEEVLRVVPVPTQPSFVPFSKFTADVSIHLGKNKKDDTFLVKGEFKLGTGSNGINPVTEPVTLKVGPFTVVIPAGSFRKLGSHEDDDHCGKVHYVFIGFVNGVLLHVHLKQDKYGMWDYHVLAFCTEMTGVTNPVTVQLIIGNDGGTTTDMAKIHTSSKPDNDGDDDHDWDNCKDKSHNHHDKDRDDDDKDDNHHDKDRDDDDRDHDWDNCKDKSHKHYKDKR
jgi:hypothetical protein